MVSSSSVVRLYRGSFRTRSIASVFSLLAKLADLSPSRNLFLGSQRTAIPGPSFSTLSVLFPPPLSILTLFYPDRRRLPLSLPSFPFDVSVLLHAEAVSSTTWSELPLAFASRGLHFPAALLFSSLTDSSALSISCYLVHEVACSRPDEIVTSSTLFLSSM